jgi:hypothetical protein
MSTPAHMAAACLAHFVANDDPRKGAYAAELLSTPEYAAVDVSHVGLAPASESTEGDRQQVLSLLGAFGEDVKLVDIIPRVVAMLREVRADERGRATPAASTELTDPAPFLDRLKRQPSRGSRIDASAFLSAFATPTQHELAHLLDMVRERNAIDVTALDRITASLADKLASMRSPAPMPDQIRGLIYAHLEEAVLRIASANQTYAVILNVLNDSKEGR